MNRRREEWPFELQDNDLEQLTVLVDSDYNDVDVKVVRHHGDEKNKKEKKRHHQRSGWCFVVAVVNTNVIVMKQSVGVLLTVI